MAGSSGNGAMKRFEVPVVVGAGPAGLSAGYALTRAGVRPKLLERGDKVGMTWRTYYDTLRLNSPRILSSLPGMTIDPGAGRFPSRVDFILYLERYARRWDLDVEYGIDVQRIDRHDGGWSLQTSKGPMWAPQVVVATGLYAQPTFPDWPGIEGFTKELMHVRQFRNAKGFVGKDVLVVGGGQSAADVALEAAALGAKHVSLSVRKPPHVSRPAHFGVSPSLFAFIVKCLPTAFYPLLDRYELFTQRILRWFIVGDVSKYGFGVPEEGLTAALQERGHGILIDRGLITALKAGQVEALPAVEGFDGDEVILADGRRVSPDVVVAGTGARGTLPSLVGHLGVLDVDGRPLKHGGAKSPGAPGLYFIGYRLPPGVLPDARRDAPAIARSITGRRAWPPPIWRTSGSGYPVRAPSDLASGSGGNGKDPSSARPQPEDGAAAPRSPDPVLESTLESRSATSRFAEARPARSRPRNSKSTR
ncbi:MAG TPA: NAD(P)/FAD-dependent oxidoreductase [Thermoleophilaceae bacterium]